MRVGAAGLAGVACAFVLAGCGGGGAVTGGVSGGGIGSTGQTVDIYASLPLRGAPAAETTEVLDAAKLALAQAGGKAGSWRVQLTPLDDGDAAGAWNPGSTAADAREAAADPKAVYYIGEWDAGASDVAIPILNEAELAQVSPASAAVTPYYPDGETTFFQLVPGPTVQATALALAMRDSGCTRVAIAHDESGYGLALAHALSLAREPSLNVVSDVGLGSSPSSGGVRSYATDVRRARVDCFVFAGLPGRGAVAVAAAVGAQLPRAQIFGGDALCARDWTNDADGGLPASAAARTQCTAAIGNLSASAAGRAFLRAWSQHYPGVEPGAYAVYGYEAMKLALETIAGLGPRGNSKSDVLAALLAVRDRPSLLGTYGFDSSGQTTLRSYGLFKVDAAGNPVFERTLRVS